jgi:hypothetical protein
MFGPAVIPRGPASCLSSGIPPQAATAPNDPVPADSESAGAGTPARPSKKNAAEAVSLQPEPI